MLRTVGLVALFVFALLNGAAVGKVCYDQDPQLCRSLKDKCEVAEYKTMLYERCKYSCDVCTPFCGDVFNTCTQVKDFCEVNPFTSTMAQCNFTCGRCGCQDLYADYCELIKDSCNTAQTKDECPVTCGVCRENCIDLRPDCARYANLCRHSEFVEAMSHSCKRTCGFCGEKHTTGYGGWIYSKVFGSWYKYICESLPFYEMEERCIENGGHLASVGSAAETMFLSTMNQCSRDQVWLGWSSSRWIDGSPIAYNPTLLNCGTSGAWRLLDAKNVGWCGANYNAAYGGICKIKVNSGTYTPPPATTAGAGSSRPSTARPVIGAVL